MDLLIDACKALVIVVGATLLIFGAGTVLVALMDMSDHPACKAEYPNKKDEDETDG